MSRETTEIRRRNLRLWIDTDPRSRGNVSEWCNHYSQFIDPEQGDTPLTPNYVRQLAPQEGPAPRNIGERVARKLERIGKLPELSLDNAFDREHWERWGNGDKSALLPPPQQVLPVGIPPLSYSNDDSKRAESGEVRTVSGLLESLRGQLNAQPDSIRKIVSGMVFEYMTSPDEDTGKRIAQAIENLIIKE